MKMEPPAPKPVRAKPVASRAPGIARANARRDGTETRERLLDAAEALFAAHGFHGTSMRDVAHLADCGIALVTYHFGSKDLLFSTVVKRRAAYVAHERMRALDMARAKAEGAPVPVEDIVTGYVWPFMERSAAGGKGWRNYLLCIARHANTPEFAKVLSEHYGPVARQYVSELERTFPNMPLVDIHYAFSFMVGGMVSMVAEPGRVKYLSYGQILTDDVKAAFHRMLPFFCAGFRSLEPVPHY